MKKTKKQISRCKWIKLTILETIFGSELLENIINSSASSSERSDKCQYGKKMKLNSFIPCGLFTNLFRQSLVEVLYYKFYCQYYLFRPDKQEHVKLNKESNTIDCTLIWFAT